MLSPTEEETSKRPMAVRSGRRSGRASATILRKDAEVEDVPPALDKRDAGRRRERPERRFGGRGEEGVGDIGDDGRESGGGARGGRTCYEGAVVSGKERMTWGASPACGGMCKCYTDGRSTSSSPSTERVCRGGDEASEVQGEHKVKVDPRPEQASEASGT